MTSFRLIFNLPAVFKWCLAARMLASIFGKFASSLTQ